MTRNSRFINLLMLCAMLLASTLLCSQAQAAAPDHPDGNIINSMCQGGTPDAIPDFNTQVNSKQTLTFSISRNGSMPSLNAVSNAINLMNIAPANAVGANNVAHGNSLGNTNIGANTNTAADGNNGGGINLNVMPINNAGANEANALNVEPTNAHGVTVTIIGGGLLNCNNANNI